MSTSREETERRMMSEAELTRAGLAGQTREAAYRARQGVEEAKQNVATGLHSAAERLREQSREMGRPGLARVAEPLDQSALYLRTHTLPQMGDDVRRTAEERPLVAAAGVFAAAFLVGRLLRRR